MQKTDQQGTGVQSADAKSHEAALDELRRSEARLNSITATASDAIICADHDGVILLWNEAAERLLGYSSTETIGHHMSLILPERARAAHEQVMRHASLHGSQRIAGRTLELVARHKSGRELPVDLSLAAWQGDHGWSYTAILRDATARKEVETTLRANEELYRRMFEAAPIAINASRGLESLYANPAFLQMFGYPSIDALQHIGPLELLPPESRALILERIQKRAAGEPVPSHYETLGRRANGETFPIDLYLSRTMFGGEPATLAFVLDVTEQKQAQAAREELHAQLQQAQKMESVGRLAGGVAHDFNNMLSVILGTTELALTSVDPATPLYADLQAIAAAARRSADLTGQLLAFARKMPATRQVLDLNDTIGGMLRMLQRLIGEDIGLHWYPAHEVWPVHIDPSQMTQVLTNLCVNARDAIADVGTISVVTSNVVLDTAIRSAHTECPAGHYVRLSVRDTGHGMDAPTQARIFEPFFTTKAVGVGTGLGLSTVYGIVTQNGGAIEVESEPGSGTTFHVHLPRHGGAPTPSTADEAHTVADTSAGHILIVEDEPSLRRLTQRILEQLGYRVSSARSGVEALEWLRTNSDPVDLLLTDVVMPEMNGRELSRQVAALAPGVRTLFMSGYTADAIGKHGVLEPGVHFLQKPFVATTLANKVREVLRSTDGPSRDA